MGKAMRAAVVDVKQQLLELAGKQLEISAADLEVVAGTVRPKDAPEKALPFPAILGPARVGNIIGRGTYQAVSHLDLDGQGVGSPQWHPAVCAVEVEVDEETGRVASLRLHVGALRRPDDQPAPVRAAGRGRAPSSASGQALFEEILWDESGQLTNANLSDYMIPSFLDVPAMAETILESDIASRCTASARRACRRSRRRSATRSRARSASRLHQIPLTPERVLRALHPWSARRRRGRIA